MDSIIGSVVELANKQLTKPFVPGKTYIYPAAPSLNSDDVAILVRVALQYWYTEWKYCAKLERGLSNAMSKHHVSLVNSGSSALLVAINAAILKHEMEYGKQDRYILTCSTGFPTTVSPIYQLGYIPVYVDMNRDLTPNMNQIEKVLNSYIGSRVCGAVFAHTLGFTFNESKVRDLLGSRRFLVSDCCDAFGASMEDGNLVGSMADLATLSFFPSHHIMSAEGGAILTDNDELADLVRSLSNWGRSCFCRPGENDTCGSRFSWTDKGLLPDGWDHKYIFDRPGYNLKMTEFQGALGFSQLSRVDEFILARRTNYRYLYNELNRSEYREYIELLSPNDGFSPFGFPILVKSTSNFIANDFIAFLETHKVGTRRLFAGNLLRQPGFMNLEHLAPFECAGSDYLMNNAFWISVSPSLTTDMLDYMVYVIDQFFIENELV